MPIGVLISRREPPALDVEAEDAVQSVSQPPSSRPTAHDIDIAAYNRRSAVAQRSGQETSW